MINVELLAPAGDMNSLIAAVENGADAVYLGGKSFNARQGAGNFDDYEIEKAIEYCHIRGVRVFVTFNTLLKDSELHNLPDVISHLYNIGTDALLIQDLGVGELIKKVLPDFELHASTQMTAHNLEAVNILYEMGYKRVVLSRELSFKEIEKISLNTKAETEVFCHGALCICYSGQCLMSSMIGGRSGNRGRCAQPCRQKYSMNNDGKTLIEGYLLSPKDLSTIEHLDLILESGVKSLKVEGRMKKPEYVAAVISTYRKAIDAYTKTGKTNVNEEDTKRLLKIFNRGGFTTAHLFNKNNIDMISTERPKNWGIYLGRISDVQGRDGKIGIILEEELSKGDGIEIWSESNENSGFTIGDLLVNGKSENSANIGDKVYLSSSDGKTGDKVYKTFDNVLNKVLENTYLNSNILRKIPLDCDMVIEREKPAQIYICDSSENCVNVEGPEPEEALKVPLTESKVREQISKLGGTPFYFNHFDVKLDMNLSMPASTMNSMRREAVERLTQKRIESFKPEYVPAYVTMSKATNILSDRKVLNKKNVKLSVFVKDSFQVNNAIEGGADIIIFGGDKLRGYDLNYKDTIKDCKDKGIEVYISSPRIIKNEYNKIISEIEESIKYGANGVYIENLGILNYALNKHVNFAAGFSINIFNYLTAKKLIDMGSRFISISPELSLGEIKQIAPYVENCEALCYGRVEMMVSEYCPVQSKVNCNKGNVGACISNDLSLTDRMGMVFPVKTDIYCRSHIYNSKLLFMLENIKDLVNSGINIIRVNIQDENKEDAFQIVRSFKNTIISINNGTKTVQEDAQLIELIKSRGFTKGHYYRGIL